MQAKTAPTRSPAPGNWPLHVLRLKPSRARHSISSPDKRNKSKRFPKKSSLKKRTKKIKKALKKKKRRIRRNPLQKHKPSPIFARRCLAQTSFYTSISRQTSPTRPTRLTPLPLKPLSEKLRT